MAEDIDLIKKEEAESTGIENKLEEHISQTKKEFNKVVKQTKEIQANLNLALGKINSWDKRLTKITTANECVERAIRKMTELNIDIEETLSNVLLAVRQNEYLQAWYPEQQGHPEMKVIGRHPCQAKTTI